jgi:hypothetical protein
VSAFNRCFPIPGDLELTEDGRDLVFFHGAAKVAQSIRVGAQIFRGSWRYDRAKGVPYFEDILVAGPQFERVRRRFHELLTETPGVTTVTRVDLRIDREDGTMYVDFAVVTETGESFADSLVFSQG